MICWGCYHFTNRRWLLGLCYEPEHHVKGLRDHGHAPYRCALCPACGKFISSTTNNGHRRSFFRAFDLAGRRLRALTAAHADAARGTATQRQRGKER